MGLDSDSLRDKAEALIQRDMETFQQFDGSKNESPTAVSTVVWYKKLLRKGTLTPIAAASALFLFFFALDAVLDSAEHSSDGISSGSELDSTILALDSARTVLDSNDQKVEVPSIPGPIDDAVLDKAAPGVGGQTKDESNNQILYEEISDNDINTERPQIAQELSAKTEEKPEVIDEAFRKRRIQWSREISVQLKTLKSWCRRALSKTSQWNFWASTNGESEFLVL